MSHEESSRFHQFLEIAGVVASSRPLDEILHEVSRRTARLCGAYRGSIFLWGKDPEAVVPVTSQLASGEPQPEWWGRFRGQEQRPLVRHRLLSRLAETRRPVVVEDARCSPYVSRSSVEDFGLRSLLGVPLQADGEVIGALLLDNAAAGPFSKDQVATARAVAEHLGLALQKSLVVEEAEKNLRRTEALYEISRAIATILELKPLLAKIAREAARACAMDRCSIYLYEDGLVVPTMSQFADARREPKLWETFLGLERTPVAEVPFFAEASENRRPLLINGAADDPRIPESMRQFILHNIVAVPLLLHDSVLGTMILDNTERPRRVSKEQAALASTIASQVALAVDNARLYESNLRTETLRALADMAGGVAHDFNNLLAAILGRTQLLLRQLELGVADEDEQQQSLRVIEQVTRDGAETVRRLLEFTRSRTGLEAATAVDVNELLRQTVEVSRHRWKDEAEACGMTIDVLVEASEVPRTAGNPAELREVLLNLVLNALEAMPSGGTLRLASRRDGEHLVVEVGDTGVGMTRDVERRVFDPFFTTKGPKASGLGLSVSYGIVQRHGGSLDVRSQPHHGTTFILRLPLRQVPEHAEKEEAVRESSPLRILVIDDEPPVRDVLTEILNVGGYSVRTAANGAEGLQALDEQRFDLVLTDLGMPGMTGWDVADRVREQWPRTKVGLISGWGPQVRDEQLAAHGVEFLIVKPFEIQTILGTIADFATGDSR